VAEYPHHEDGRCKYRVFEKGTFVASFEPDARHILHICQSSADFDEQILHLLADQIELYHPHNINNHIEKPEG
jgi:hypothetical protein